MRTYTRNALDDFGKMIAPADMEKAIATARGRTPLMQPQDPRSFTQVQAELISEDIAIPAAVIAAALNEDTHKGMSEVLNDWIINCDVVEYFTAICDALLARTESAFSDTKWANGYAKLVAEVFNVPEKLGLEAMETPSQAGQRWGLLVASATAMKILTISN